VKAYGRNGEVANSNFRGVCWKLYLGLLPDDNISKWSEEMVKHRKYYETLRSKYVIDPSSIPGDMDLARNNPLSLDDNNPWKKYFDDSELKKTIFQDVDRTFPDQEFFRSEEVQNMMTQVLFVWSRDNEDLSYRQGMHELLALIFFVIYNDKIGTLPKPDNDSDLVVDELMTDMASPAYVEHDSYLIFERLMSVTKAWFDSGQKQGEMEISGNRRVIDETALFGKGGQENLQKSSEVIKKCHRIHHQLLKLYDPDLYNHLMKLGVEPQIYGLKWIRLLFGREFHVADVLKLWDAIFADDSKLGVVDYLCISMLLYLRAQLLQADFTGCLARLMKFPPVEDVLWLFERAIKIRDAPMNLKPIPINAPPPPITGDPLQANRALAAANRPYVQNVTQPQKPPTRPIISNNLMGGPSSYTSNPITIFASPLNPTPSPAPVIVPNLGRRSPSPTPRMTEKERALKNEVDNLKRMNATLSQQLQKGILILHQELLESAERATNLETVQLAMAGLKQVKDILAGNLTFDDSILLINNTAFAAANDILRGNSNQGDNNANPGENGEQGEKSGEAEAETREGEGEEEERERQEKERQERKEEERQRKKKEEEEKIRKEEERIRKEEERRRKEEERRRKEREEEERIKREEEDQSKKSKVPVSIFDDDDDFDPEKKTQTTKTSDKLDLLLN